MGPGQQQRILIFLTKFITCVALDMSEGYYAGLALSISNPHHYHLGLVWFWYLLFPTSHHNTWLSPLCKRDSCVP